MTVGNFMPLDGIPDGDDKRFRTSFLYTIHNLVLKGGVFPEA